MEISLVVPALYDAIHRPRRLDVAFFHHLHALESKVWGCSPQLLKQRERQKTPCSHTLAASPWAEPQAHGVFLFPPSVPRAPSYFIYTVHASWEVTAASKGAERSGAHSTWTSEPAHSRIFSVDTKEWQELGETEWGRKIWGGIKN